MSNDELIARAEAALDGVTDGPWVVEYVGSTTELKMNGDSQMGDETYYPWVPENLKDWEFFAASRDLVPALLTALKASKARVKELEEALSTGIDLIKGEKTGLEWKKACRNFIKDARAAQKGGVE